MPKIKVVCRHGVEYSLLARGTQGEVYRLKQMLSNCCCYVCHNRGCETPIEGKQECKHECDLFGKVFCEKKENSMRKKESWMKKGAIVRALGKLAIIVKMEENEINGIDYVYYITIRFLGEKKTARVHPDDIERTE